jgi:hypothetical protein
MPTGSASGGTSTGGAGGTVVGCGGGASGIGFGLAGEPGAAATGRVMTMILLSGQRGAFAKVHKNRGFDETSIEPGHQNRSELGRSPLMIRSSVIWKCRGH